MIVFLPIAALLLVASLAWILRPLLLERSQACATREASNLSILLDQVHELNADLAVGALSVEQHAKAREELEQRTLEDTCAGEVAERPTRRVDRVTAVVIAMVVPIAATLLYAELGNPRALLAPVVPPSPRGVPERAAASENDARIVAALTKRLEEAPDDAAAWAMLARTYSALRNLPQAATAFAKAISLSPEDPDLLVDYADVLAASRAGRLEGEPLEFIGRALKANPRHWKGLLLSGKAAFDRGDFREALSNWENARATIAPDSPIVPALEASIAKAKQMAASASATGAAITASPASGR